MWVPPLVPASVLRMGITLPSILFLAVVNGEVAVHGSLFTFMGVLNKARGADKGTPALEIMCGTLIYQGFMAHPVDMP